MTSEAYIQENKTETFKKGDKVVMHSCAEAFIKEYKNKVWTCLTDSFLAKSKEEVVFLDGFSGYFSAEFLTKQQGAKVSFKKLFTLIDGRLSTKVEHIYEMLNYIFDDNFHTHQLPSAINKLKEVNPEWFSDAVNMLNTIKEGHNTNDFKELMEIIDLYYEDHEFELGKIDFKIPFSAGLMGI